MLISIHDLSYTYPGATRPALHHLNLEVPEGEFLLVAGPSGAGKSTLLRLLNGLVPHFYGGTLSGQVRVGGRDPVALGPHQMADLVGFIFQDPEAQAVADRVEDELVFGMENLAIPPLTMRKRVEETLDQLRIAHLRHRRLNTLSGGERQRTAIAATLTLQPRLLVLDEPTSQLDPQAAEEVLALLQRLNRDLGLTIILAEHRLERVVEYVDRILYLPGETTTNEQQRPGEQPVDTTTPPVYCGAPAQILAQMPFVPPVVELGRRLGWEPLPLSIKEARRWVSNSPRPAPQLSLSASPPPAGPPVVQVNQVSFSYNGHRALQSLNLSVNRGELVAIMGRNGSGKTTLLKHLVGLLQPQSGQIHLFGQPIAGRSPQEIAARVAYIPQNPNTILFADTLQEELAFTRRGHHLPPGDDAGLLARLGLAGKEACNPRDLSGGERQRAALAAMLVARPELILLDEPTRGLDYAQKAALVAFLRHEQQQGHTILLVTHDVELVAQCANRVILMADGEIVVDGPTRQVMTESLVFAPQINKLYRNPHFLTVEDVTGR